MRVVAVWTIRGRREDGSAVNLAALPQQRVAHSALDLDPQGAASFYFRVKPKVKGGGRKLLRRSAELRRWIRGTDFDNLDLLPADSRIAALTSTSMAAGVLPNGSLSSLPTGRRVRRGHSRLPSVGVAGE